MATIKIDCEDKSLQLVSAAGNNPNVTLAVYKKAANVHCMLLSPAQQLDIVNFLTETLKLSGVEVIVKKELIQE